MQNILRELIQRDGLANEVHDPRCSKCSRKSTHEHEIGFHLLQCRDCGPALLCRICCLDNHQLLPLHRLQVSVL